ncbi:sigma-70 family RNA polymerase sigma factor [Myxococcus hansupus]|nr:sigma-70 family RNA polymerase sigma factor [Myxococcus hansupus]
MTGQASPEERRSSERRTNGWQFALFALSLALFAIHVLIPLGALAFIGTAIASATGASYVLSSIGALTPGIFDGAVYLASALLLFGAMLAGGVMVWNFIGQLRSASAAPPRLLKRPWLLVGILFAVACWLVSPSDAGQSRNPVLVGAFVLATSIWAILYAGYLLWSLGAGGLAFAWRMGRLSPFAAGILTLACLGSTASAFHLVAATEESRPQAPLFARTHAEEPCRSASFECTRQFLLASSAANDAPRALTAHTPASSFKDCIESRFQDRAMLEKAERIANRLVGTANASDVVHGALLSVCLNEKRHHDFEQYFLRSVQYGALKWLRGVRTCPIDDEPEPFCELRPDDQYVRSETQHVVQQVLCSLGEQHREVLLMRYFDDLSEWEIAQRLGIDYAAARKRVQRARDKFFDEFHQRCR